MKKQNASFFFSLVLGGFLPYVLYGFQYLPILDDYIQYGSYPLYQDVSYVYLTIGTLAARPVSSLLDPVFWGNFRHVPGVALALITALHLLSAGLFYKISRRFQITLSPLFFVIYLFAPLGMEGRYWLSASTRIITGLFFASVSLWFSALFLTEKQSRWCLLLFALFQLVSFGFYESVTVFSALCTLFLFAAGFEKSKKKKLLFVPVITGINLVLILLYYYVFKDLGLMESRTGGISLLKIFPNFTAVLRQAWEVFSHSSALKGSFWGIKILLSNSIWGIFLLLLAGLLSFVLCKHNIKDKTISKQKFFRLFGCGFLLFFAPLLPHAMTETVWVTNRSLFVPLIGLALMLEGFMELFHKKHLQKIIIFLISFVFLTANINEYDIYLRAGRLDEAILNEIIPVLDEEVLSGRKNLQVVLPEAVRVRQNAFYKDHVASIFDSDWALTGALRAKTKSLAIRRAEPVLAGGETDKAAQVVVIKEAKE